MLEELNNILDRINNWIIFTEARNSGLIAMNLGLLSFVNSVKNVSIKGLLIVLCTLSILISAYSFVGLSIKSIKKSLKIKNKFNENTNEKSNEIVNKNINFDYKDNSLIEKYSNVNIYKYMDIYDLDECTFLNLVYTKLFRKNDSEEIPININRAYQFKLAHKDIAKKIRENANVCLVKSKCFYMSLSLFVTVIILLGISLVI